MKALLICPDERFGLAALAEWVPLANLSVLGKTLVAYWLEHLATLGAQEVLVLARRGRRRRTLGIARDRETGQVRTDP
jgi:hypothetical protein